MGQAQLPFSARLVCGPDRHEFLVCRVLTRACGSRIEASLPLDAPVWEQDFLVGEGIEG